MIRRAVQLAWLRVRREPVRTGLAILGVTAIGALLFDMLLLSNGLLVSFRERLDQSGFDVRVMAGESAVVAGPPIEHASAAVDAVRRLPSVRAVQRVTIGSADVDGHPGGRHLTVIGVDWTAPLPLTVVRGTLPRATGSPAAVVVNRRVAEAFGASPGSRLTLDGRCGSTSAVLPMPVQVSAVADFQNDATDALTAATSADALAALCGNSRADRADFLLVASNPSAGGAAAAAAAIRDALPGLHVVTNAELVERFSRVEFSYFRQLSGVLTVVTLFFGLLLIAVLLTVSVNQQLGELAALRALGLTRGRVMAGVLCESAFLIGLGGLAAIPAGGLLSIWLDGILRSLPGIPSDAHFFVFTPRALALHAGLMTIGAVAAALYPMRLVAALPIAATLRREVVS
jgi:putative ABC transport system permease protein